MHRALAVAALFTVAVPAPAQKGFSESYSFLEAVKKRDGATAQGILDNPSSTAVNAREASTGEGALHILVRGRDLTWLRFLLSRGARPDAQANDGTTPLGLAAQLGWRDGVETLLGGGASVDLANSRGETPLILAVQGRSLPVVRLLLARGANPDATDSVAGLSALDYARADRRSAAILRLLEEQDARPEGQVMGPTR